MSRPSEGAVVLGGCLALIASIAAYVLFFAFLVFLGVSIVDSVWN